MDHILLLILLYIFVSVNFNKSVGGFFASYIFSTISLSTIFFLSLYAINNASYEYFNISLGKPPDKLYISSIASSVNKFELPASSNLFLINNLPLSAQEILNIFLL